MFSSVLWLYVQIAVNVGQTFPIYYLYINKYKKVQSKAGWEIVLDFFAVFVSALRVGSNYTWYKDCKKNIYNKNGVTRHGKISAKNYRRHRHCLKNVYLICN